MNINKRVSLLFLHCTLLLTVRGDYECLCNYNVEWSVYNAATPNSNEIGTLYEFDCKPTVPESEHAGFKKIQFEQQAGFVQMNNQVQIQTCSGDPSPLDVVTTVATTPAVNPTTTSPPSTMAPTSTPAPLTIHSTTLIKSTSTSTVKPTILTTTPLVTSTVTSTTTPVKTTVTSTTTPIPSTSTAKAATTSSTTQTTTTTVMDTTRIVSTSAPILQGHTDLCPPHVLTDSRQKGGFLGQYGSFCFQLVDWPITFENAEHHCHSLSGTLASIGNQAEQDYIQNLLSRHIFTKQAWIGLNDMKSEGQYTWTSGVPVTYTNFQNGYNQHSTATHKLDDCFVIQTGGQWVDAPCGISISFINLGEQHPFICQYNVTAKLHTLFEAIPDIVG